MDLIIFGGQSNMQGQTECLSENEIVANAYEYKWLTDQLVPLKNPAGENITCELKEGYVFYADTDVAWSDTHVTGSACYNHTNMVPSFCRAYTQITQRDVVAAHIAKGSTSISQWLPGSPGYDIIVKKAAAAKAKTNPVHIFFVWLQGESDAVFENTKDNYKRQLVQLSDALKKDIGIETFGIIRVGHFLNDARDDEIICAQTEICNEHPDFLMLTDIATQLNAQPKYMHPSIGGHFSAKGLEKLGSEAGKTLANHYI